MHVTFPFINQIVARPPRKKEIRPMEHWDVDTFDIPEIERSAFVPAMGGVGEYGGHTYWHDGSHWAYFGSKTPGEYRLDDVFQLLSHGAVRRIALAFGVGGFLEARYAPKYHSADKHLEELPNRKNIADDYRHRIAERVATALAANAAIVEGHLMLRVREPAYGLYLETEGRRDAPWHEAKLKQETLRPVANVFRHPAILYAFDEVEEAKAGLDAIGGAGAQRRRADHTFGALKRVGDFASEDLHMASVRSMALDMHASVTSRKMTKRAGSRVGDLFRLAMRDDEADAEALFDLADVVVKNADEGHKLLWEVFVPRFQERPVSLDLGGLL